MLSQTALYALQSVLFIARRQAEDGPVSAASVAEALDLPGEYLAKTLQRLKEEGLLVSSRGARGGYELTAPASALPLSKVITPFQNAAFAGRCLMGGVCDLDQPCVAHERWSQVQAATEGMLSTVTVGHLMESDVDAPVESPPTGEAS